MNNGSLQGFQNKCNLDMVKELNPRRSGVYVEIPKPSRVELKLVIPKPSRVEL
jgi:hypothetical protein